MKSFSWRIIVGAVLVVFGALALMQSMGVMRYEGTLWGVFFGLIFAAAGAGFMMALLQDPIKNWWAAIPGMTLIGLGILISLAELKVQPSELLPAIFMGCIGASFLIVYFLDRQRWWAIIPGGAVVSIAVMILFAQTGSWPAVILFGGLALSFGLVAITTRPGERSRAWAWYPALAMVVLAAIIASTATPLPGIIWPIILIVAGLAMVAWTVVGKRAS
jgi:hypothetical protein